MNMSVILDIAKGIRNFFSSLAVSISFNTMFIIGLAIEVAIILFFVIKSFYSYELRMTKILDRLNRWLFINKKITTDNIKEFTNIVKSGPKRLEYNWQQYILYREQAPSGYISIDNIIEKPLRASSFSSNIKNLGLFSWVFAGLMFFVSLAQTGVSSSASTDAVLNSYTLIVAMVVPFVMLILCVVAKLFLSYKKNSNLDVLYQNLHLFQRFVDNACVELPQFIDFTLLFSVEEIEKGIPALREFLENRARKEKEEFDKAKNEMIEFEKYDFGKAGVDGSNILERAMRESETYLNNKAKTLAKITQIEASLESLKKNFDNIQKDYQRKIQVSKENIDRLRQQQEETTSRIESNFLRKQQMTEISKQEKEESDFEQQKRRYLVEKNDCEEEIRNLNNDLEKSKTSAEKAMLSEYQTFFTRLCKKANEDVSDDVKAEINNLKNTTEEEEENLAEAQTLIKRLQDENLTLRRKMGVDETTEIAEIMGINTSSDEDNRVKGKSKVLSEDEWIDKVPVEKGNKGKKKEKKPVDEISFDDMQEKAEFEEYPETEAVENYDNNGNIESIEEYEPVEDGEYRNGLAENYQGEQVNEEYSDNETEEYDENEEYTDEDIDDGEYEEESVEDEYDENSEEYESDEDDEYNEYETDETDEDESDNEEVEVKRKRGRPVGSFKVKKTVKKASRGRGRPRKEETATKVKRGRGRPAGSFKKVNSPSMKKKVKEEKVVGVKKGRGRPRKDNTLNDLSTKIKNEERKAINATANANNKINKAIQNLDNGAQKERERIMLIEEIEKLKKQAANSQNYTTEELEEISHKVEDLLRRIDELEG